MDISNRIRGFQASPIRRLSPYARAAKERGIKVYHLNIGQPDIKSPVEAIQAIHNYPNEIIAYGESDGDMELRKALVKYYHDNKPYEYYCRHEIYDPHNTPILVLISTGLVGLILLLVLVFYTLKRIFVYYRAGRFRVADYCALAVLITTFTAIMFESDIFYLCNTTSLVFWMTLGFVLGRTEQTVKTQH